MVIVAYSERYQAVPTNIKVDGISCPHRLRTVPTDIMRFHGHARLLIPRSWVRDPQGPPTKPQATHVVRVAFFVAMTKPCPYTTRIHQPIHQRAVRVVVSSRSRQPRPPGGIPSHAPAGAQRVRRACTSRLRTTIGMPSWAWSWWPAARVAGWRRMGTPQGIGGTRPRELTPAPAPVSQKGPAPYRAAS